MQHYNLYHALGNRYLVSNLGQEIDSRTARLHCQAYNADGVLVGSIVGESSFALRIFNADGSEAEQSGNGTRIFAKFLKDNSLVENDTVIIIPPAGPVHCTFEKHDIVRANLGRYTIFDKISLNIEENGIVYSGYRVSVGNPHFVIRTITPDWRSIASSITTNKTFQFGTNVEFFDIIDRCSIHLCIFERGVGEVKSCGSGAAATSAVAYEICNLSPQMQVNMDGGALNVSCSDGFVSISGPIIRDS
jgi:diaminopimelate epimerase